eukprot:g6188.t2
MLLELEVGGPSQEPKESNGVHIPLEPTEEELAAGEAADAEAAPGEDGEEAAEAAEEEQPPEPPTLSETEILVRMGNCAPEPGNQASPKGEDYTVRVTGAMSRLVAAAEVLLAVNSGNTVAAGLAVASFGSLFVAPPIGVALGATSAAAGEGLRQQMSGALRCPLCDEPLGFGARELRRCSRFHCFHAHCVQEGCPECEEPVARVKSTDQLGALLWLAGIRDFCALTLDSLAPQLNHARDLVQRLTTSEDVGLIMQRRVDDEAPEEVAEAHEAWQLAMEETHLLDGTCLAKVAVEKLLLGYGGMPLKYRHRLWPHLLGSISGRALEELLLVPLPPKVSEQINADVPRTRHSLVAGRHAALRRVLHAVGAARPEVGYAQGMNQLAAVFLKLGFEEEKAVHMMDAIMKDLLPGCHHPDLHGLFRDTGLSTSPCYGFRDRRDSGDMVHCGLLLNPWLQRNIVAIYCWAELEDSELLMKKFKAALAEASPDGFAAQTAEFLHERQGGISDELISTLRDQVTST